MVLVNKVGFAEILCNRTKTIKIGFETRLYAQFNNVIGKENIKTTPLWIIECGDESMYEVSTSENEMCLSISSDYDHEGVVKITLADEEGYYKPYSVVLKTINPF